jgi:hypothetical protein
MLFFRKINSIENVRIFTMPGFLLKGAFAFPGLGIFVHRAHVKYRNLLMHEFGHILQFRNYGFFVFWLRIAPVSFFSALKSRINLTHQHKLTKVEINANVLAYHYFKKPTDWNHSQFPIK